MARPGVPSFPALPTPPLPARRPPTGAPLEARRGAANRLDSITGKLHCIQGFIEIIGSGEALLDVNFPVWFLEHPNFTFGGEMAPNQILTAGQYPMLSILVHRWAMREFPAGVSYYSGATLIVVSSGADDQRLIGHWRAEGKALRNPGGETLTVDARI